MRVWRRGGGRGAATPCIPRAEVICYGATKFSVHGRAAAQRRGGVKVREFRRALSRGFSGGAAQRRWRGVSVGGGAASASAVARQR